MTYFLGDEDNANCKRLREETSSGTFVTNECFFQVTNKHLPFGGVGESGMGRYHGVAGMESFSNMKSYMIRPTPAKRVKSD